MAATPVLQQAAAEVAGKWKNWSAKLSAPAQRDMQSSARHPAGWYPDPEGASLQRWWDGSSWTDKTRSP